MPLFFSNTYSQEYACAAIRNFFDSFRLPDAVWYIETITEAATTDKVWSHSSPGSILYFMEYFHPLLTAAYVLDSCYSKDEKAVIQSAPARSYGAHEGITVIAADYTCRNAWGDFPRSLTLLQYNNPYKAIKKFCKYMQEGQWMTALKEVTEYALERSPITELAAPYNILKVHRHLLRLTEACHLVDVRTRMLKEQDDTVKQQKD